MKRMGILIGAILVIAGITTVLTGFYCISRGPYKPWTIVTDGQGKFNYVDADGGIASYRDPYESYERAVLERNQALDESAPVTYRPYRK